MEQEPQKNEGRTEPGLPENRVTTGGSDPAPVNAAEAAPAIGTAPAESASSPPPSPAVANTLTKEEQWALFEKELKENDWGHQPC